MESESLARFEEAGYLAIEGALSPENVGHLTDAVDRVYAKRAPGGGPLHELAFLGHDERFLDLVDHRATLPLLVALLGWNIYVYHCHLDVHPPVSSAAPTWRWHQDGGRQNVELESPRPRLSAKAAYFLTDVPDAKHGAMWVLPGSHADDVLERPEDGSVIPEGAIPLRVTSGTAVIFDRRLWHARGDNTSSSTRKALFYGYTHRWVRPRDELQLDPAVLSGLDPVRRQLLGAGTGALGYWIPTDEDVPLRELIGSK